MTLRSCGKTLVALALQVKGRPVRGREKGGGGRILPGFRMKFTFNCPSGVILKKMHLEGKVRTRIDSIGPLKYSEKLEFYPVYLWRVIYAEWIWLVF